MRPSKTQREYLEWYINICAESLGLKDWTFHFGYSDGGKHDDGSSLATVEVTNHQREATIWFSSVFWHEETSVQRRAIAHELLHCHTHAMCVPVHSEAVSENLGANAASFLRAHFDEAEEQVVDAIARAIAAWLPDFAPKDSEPEEE